MIWYQAGKRTRKLRQAAGIRPYYVAINLGIKPSVYKQVERGEMRLAGEYLIKWANLVALGTSVKGKGQDVKLTEEQCARALCYAEAVRRAQAMDKAKHRGVV